MDEHPGETPATPPFAPPPPTYQPPQPSVPTATMEPPAQVAAPPSGPGGGAPQGYVPASPAPQPKKKTWLWLVLAIVVLGAIGCCAAMALGGAWIFGTASGPTAAIDSANQAALDGDQAAFEKYFDITSVAGYAYEDLVVYLIGTPDFADLVAEVGPEEAERLLREEYMTLEMFTEEMRTEFAVTGEESLFPDYQVVSTSIDGDTAELTITSVEEGEDVTYVLGLQKTTADGEDVWRIVQVKNLVDFFEEQGVTE